MSTTRNRAAPRPAPVAPRRSYRRRSTLPDDSSGDRFAVWLTAIAIVGLVARVVATLAANRYADLGLGDGFFYHHSANLLADGRGYVDPIRVPIGDARATALHPPLWSSVLAVPSAVGLDSQLAHRLVGCVIGAASVVAVGCCGRLLAGPRVGYAAAVIYALHPTLLAADGSLHAETVFGLFGALALLAALMAARDTDSRAAAAAGAFAALAALARGEGLVLAVLLALALASLSIGSDRWRMPLALVAATLVLIVPWTARNTVMLGQPVLLATNDSTVLAGANCDPTYFGPDKGTWHLECIRAVPFELTEVERSNIWREDAFEYGLDNLERTPVVATARFLRVWGLWDPGGQEIIEGRSPGIQHAGIVLHVVLVLPLAVAGLWLGRRRVHLPLRLVAVPLITVSLTGVLAFGTLRFRHGAEAALALLAAITLVALHDRIRGSDHPARYPDTEPTG